MINNARAESDAMCGRGVDDKVLPSTERADGRDPNRASIHLSDGEASLFDEADIDSVHQRRSSNLKRGSV